MRTLSVIIKVEDFVYNHIQDMICEAKKNGQKMNISKAVGELTTKSCLITESAKDCSCPDSNVVEIKPILPVNIDEIGKAETEKFDYQSLGLLTNKETAKYVGVDINTICEAHKTGALTCKRIGHTQYQRKEDIDKWNAERIQKMFTNEKESA